MIPTRRVMSVRRNSRYERIVDIETDDGVLLCYLYRDGILIPGRTYICFFVHHTVHLFLPIPDGMPEVLEIESVESTF